ncbi:exported hypothetical protein [Syntrophobacter sp. SbD1]|nr:exported hypothetical protein [Syntrophobacter sp. SbD1]
MKKLILTLLAVLGLLGFVGVTGSFAVAPESCGDQGIYGMQPALPDMDTGAAHDFNFGAGDGASPYPTYQHPGK